MVRASWSDERTLRLESTRALNLRKADWGIHAKNDVYVQAYHPPDTWGVVDTTKALPPPQTKVELPAGEYTFELPPLKLPDHLPAAHEPIGCERCYVRYYIAAKVDIAFWRDPITRTGFTVVPRSSADSIPSQLVTMPMMHKTVHPSCYMPPCCCDESCACFELTCFDQVRPLRSQPPRALSSLCPPPRAQPSAPPSVLRSAHCPPPRALPFSMRTVLRPLAVRC
jgi:hypothetical protein